MQTVDGTAIIMGLSPPPPHLSSSKWRLRRTRQRQMKHLQLQLHTLRLTHYIVCALPAHTRHILDYYTNTLIIPMKRLQSKSSSTSRREISARHTHTHTAAHAIVRIQPSRCECDVLAMAYVDITRLETRDNRSEWRTCALYIHYIRVGVSCIHINTAFLCSFTADDVSRWFLQGEKPI